jgi:protein-L-isoaspartate(D-aspartate) O-methyltransferase
MRRRLDMLRRRYAKAMTAPLGDAGEAIRAAFAHIPREAFLGPPPWQVPGAFSTETTSDPAAIYRDVLVVLAAAKGLNNGSPALHARMLHLLGAAPGDHVVHAGAGSGYYTAILAELVGPAGRVTAVEFDPALAAAARENLRGWPRVTVVQGDAADYPTEDVQRIYVNFGLALPADAWLDRLAVGGVLLFPLGTPDPLARGEGQRHTGRAAILVVTRTTRGYAAAFDASVAFVFAEGATAGDPALRTALWEAFGRGGIDRVRCLHRGRLPAAGSWVSSERFSLGFEPL